MPYARVGVIPPPNNNNGTPSQQRSSSGRKQGITMGDLKKQTALRLAQEQQQTRFFPNLTQQRKEDAAVLEQAHAFPRSNFPDPRQPPSPQPPPPMQTPMQPAIVYPRSNSVSSNPSTYASENSHRQHQSQKGSGGGHNSKLPHGLTVQELKEMTKARLQAEHQPDQSRAVLSPYQPQQQQLYPQQQSRIDPRGSPFAEPRGSPFAERSRNVNHGFGQEHMMPPPPSGPPGFQSLPSQTSLSSAPEVSRQSSWQHPGLEAWETGSVDTHNSTINSDYLGSESAYPVDEFGEIPFNRSRSYSATPAGLDRQYDTHGNMVGNPSYYEQHMNPNRRRAATMSPRTLSHLHEDRPSCAGVAGLSIPFDSSPTQHPPSFRPSPMEDNGLSDYSGVSRTFSGPGDVNNNNFSFNRPRTASAPSIPSSPFVTQTGDMFGETSNGLLSNNHDLPKSMVESLLGGSSTSLSRNTSDFSSVFRSSSFDAGGGKNPWGAGTLGGGGISSGSVDNDLVRDLGSVLSLSGTENPPGTRSNGDGSLFSRSSITTNQQMLGGIYGNNNSLSGGGHHSLGGRRNHRDQHY